MKQDTLDRDEQALHEGEIPQPARIRLFHHA